MVILQAPLPWCMRWSFMIFKHFYKSVQFCFSFFHIHHRINHFTIQKTSHPNVAVVCRLCHVKCPVGTSSLSQLYPKTKSFFTAIFRNIIYRIVIYAQNIFESLHCSSKNFSYICAKYELMCILHMYECAVCIVCRVVYDSNLKAKLHFLLKVFPMM